MKKKLLSAICAAFVAFGAFSTPVQTALGSNSVCAEAASSVATPTASRKSGTVITSGSVKVTLSCATKGATVYYSANGGSYKRYTKALSLTKNTTLKVYAVKNGESSAVRKYTYKLAPKVTVSCDSGTYSGTQKVTLSSPVSGVKYYYTLDGSKPTKSSKLYTAGGITVSESCTLRVLTSKSGWTGRYISKEYEIAKSTLPQNSIVSDYTSKYAYSTLSSVEKKAYARLFEAVAAHNDSADLEGLGLTEDDLKDVFWAFDYDNAQFFWLGNGYSYSYYTVNRPISVSPYYSRSESQAKEIQPMFDAAAQEIIDKALKKDNVFDVLQVIHDEIILRTEYRTSGGKYISEADGPLVYGKALCEGYSKAFMYLAQSVGVNCVCVTNSDHMWNMVEIDGVWYHVDVTWDDPVGGDGEPYYDYFLVSDSVIYEDHKLSCPFPVKKATASGYDYFEHHGITVYTTVSDGYNALAELCAKNYAAGVYTTTIVLESRELADKVVARMKDNYAFFNSLEALGCDASSWSSTTSGGELTVTLK